MGTRRTTLGLVLAALVLATGCGSSTGSGGGTGGGTGSGGGGAAASCAAPYLDDRPPGEPSHGGRPVVRVGEDVTVYGHFYTSTCNDTGGDTGGHDPLEPLPPVTLTVRMPDGDVVDLGTHTPSGPDAGFAAVLHVPPTAAPGVATVRDDGDPHATLEIEVRAHVEPGPR